MRTISPPVSFPACCLAGLCLLFSSCGAKPPAAGDAGEWTRYFCEETGKPFFAETVKGSGKYLARRPGALPAGFLMPKPAGVKRVFVVGESVAAILDRGEVVLYGGPFKAWLARRLAGAGIRRGGAVQDIEIINCGMGGYDAYRVHGVLAEVLRYSPDLVVVLAGNNQEGITGPSCPGPASELRRRKLRLYQRYYALKDGQGQAPRKAGLRVFSEDIAGMSAAAGKAGVPLLLCTLPLNAADMPARQPLPFSDARFSAGYKLFYEKKYEPALDEFLAGLKTGPGSPFLNYYAGKTLERLGRSAEARPYFFSALSADGTGRSGPDRNEAIRKAAAGGACVADLEKFLNTLSPGGAPGFAQFTDGVHWRPEYNRVIWDEIFRSATACGLKGYEKFQAADHGQWRESPGRDALKRLNYALAWLSGGALSDAALAELSYLRVKAPDLLEDAAVSPRKLQGLVLHEPRSMGSAEAGAVFPFFLEHLAETERRRGNYAGALSLCERAMALRPGDVNFGLLRAQVLAGLGRKEEADGEFARLAGDAAAKDFRGLVQAYVSDLRAPGPAAGPGPAAAAAPRSPLLPSPSGKDAGLIARCFAAAHNVLDREKALQACQALVYLDSSGELMGKRALPASDASLRSCRLLAELGRAEEAREMLAWTVKSAPPDWKGLPEARTAAAQLGLRLD